MSHAALAALLLSAAATSPAVRVRRAVEPAGKPLNEREEWNRRVEAKRGAKMASKRKLHRDGRQNKNRREG